VGRMGIYRLFYWDGMVGDDGKGFQLSFMAEGKLEASGVSFGVGMSSWGKYADVAPFDVLSSQECTWQVRDSNLSIWIEVTNIVHSINSRSKELHCWLKKCQALGLEVWFPSTVSILRSVLFFKFKVRIF
jgi:hypothetical protein